MTHQCNLAIIGSWRASIRRKQLDQPCPHCGVVNPEGKRFCSACGQALALASPVRVDAEPKSRITIARTVIQAGVKALVGSLVQSALFMAPGFVLLWMQWQLAGVVWLFLAGFAFMARSYRKPWRLGVVSCLLPPLAAAGCYALQILLFEDVIPLNIVVLAATLGLLLGYVRARTHRVRRDDRGAPVADRTVGYLIIWALAYGLTQLFAYLAVNSFQTRAGLVTGAFSTAMLAAVNIVIWTRRQQMPAEG